MPAVTATGSTIESQGSVQGFSVVFDAGNVQLAMGEPGAASLENSDQAEWSNGARIVVIGQPRFKQTLYHKAALEHGAAHALGQVYEDHGRQALQHVFGAFCCCIVDPDKNRVLAAVDRLGQHSLYYRQNATGLHIATNARLLLQAAAGSAQLLEQGIYNYVYFHMVPSPGTIYPQIGKLPAAHALEYQDNALNTHCYWLPKFQNSSSNADFHALRDDLQKTLRESVSNCLPEKDERGGKVGAFLSGGLDSSTVAGVMSELCDEGEAYAIGFAADGYDEMAYARITAQHFGIKLNEYYVTPEDVMEALPLIATSYDEPFGNSSALPAYFCARMAKENGVSTLLAGDGGDEIFAGNERYAFQGLFRHYQRVPAWLRNVLIEPGLNLLPDSIALAAKARSYIAQAKTPLPDRLQNYNFLHQHAPEEIFTEALLETVDTQLPLTLQREVFHRPQDADELNRMLYLDWQFTLADNDLRKVTQMCSAAGVGVTYPMLDDSLIEFSCRVPSELKLKGKDLRHFYKRALTGWLPHETIQKNKQGFGLPFGVWMKEFAPLRELAYDSLQNLKQRNVIRPQFIDQAIDMHQSEHAAYYGELIWILTVFELWMDAKANQRSQQ